MGCGHRPLPSHMAIKQCGISCVIAESFDRNFFRNSIALGLPIIEYKKYKAEGETGDELEVDLHAGVIKTSPPAETMKFTPFPNFLQEILELGGMNLTPTDDR